MTRTPHGLAWTGCFHGCRRLRLAPRLVWLRIFLSVMAVLVLASPVRGEVQLVRYELRIDPRRLADLDRNPDSDQTHPARFVAGGSEYKIRVRYRGSWARSWPKKAFKVFFEEGKEFEGARCLNLNSAWRDPAFVREPLAYHVYEVAGVPASRSRMVRLDVNGEFRGLYVEVEQPDKPLFKRHQLKGVAIYKANSPANQSDERDLGSERSVSAHYEKETRKGEGHLDLQQFCHELAVATNVLQFFSNRVDLPRYVSYLAAGALVQNWDGLNKNHFLVHDERGSKKWIVVPWDLDRTFGDHWRGGFDRADVPLLLGRQSLPGPTGWNRMADRFFSDTTLRKMFLDRVEELLEKEFTAEKLFPILDQFESQLAEDAVRDRRRWRGANGLHSGIAEVKSVIERRRTFVRRELTRLRRE
jgi:spore coat protein H